MIEEQPAAPAKVNHWHRIAANVNVA